MPTAIRRRRSPALPTIVGVALIVAAFVIYATVWSEKLWFDSIGFTQVFTTQLLTQVLLFVVGTVVMGGAILGNMALAFRTRPPHRRTGASAVLDRYRDLLEHNRVTTMVVPSLMFGAMAGLSAAAQALPVLA